MTIALVDPDLRVAKASSLARAVRRLEAEMTALVDEYEDALNRYSDATTGQARSDALRDIGVIACDLDECRGEYVRLADRLVGVGKRSAP